MYVVFIFCYHIFCYDAFAKGVDVNGLDGAGVPGNTAEQQQSAEALDEIDGIAMKRNLRGYNTLSSILQQALADGPTPARLPPHRSSTVEAVLKAVAEAEEDEAIRTVFAALIAARTVYSVVTNAVGRLGKINNFFMKGKSINMTALSTLGHLLYPFINKEDHPELMRVKAIYIESIGGVDDIRKVDRRKVPERGGANRRGIILENVAQKFKDIIVDEVTIKLLLDKAVACARRQVTEAAANNSKKRKASDDIMISEEEEAAETMPEAESGAAGEVVAYTDTVGSSSSGAGLSRGKKNT